MLELMAVEILVQPSNVILFHCVCACVRACERGGGKIKSTKNLRTIMSKILVLNTRPSPYDISESFSESDSMLFILIYK